MGGGGDKLSLDIYESIEADVGIMRLNINRGVLVFLKFGQFSPERKETGSLGTTESEVWIGNFNVKAWKTTEHKLHKIWRSLKFCKISGKRAHPRVHVV